MIHVASVTPEAGFALVLGFSNGEQRRFDMNAYLDFPVYHRLQNPGFFALAKVDGGTVVWPGNIDIDPETLYDRSVPVNTSQVPSP